MGAGVEAGEGLNTPSEDTSSLQTMNIHIKDCDFNFILIFFKGAAGVEGTWVGRAWDVSPGNKTMNLCSTTANTYFFYIFNVICVAFKAHLFSTSARGFILFFISFFSWLRFGLGGGRRGVSAGAARKGDELPRDPLSCSPWYSQR